MSGTNIFGGDPGRYVGGEDPTRDDHLVTLGYFNAHSGGAPVDVTDGSTTVTGITELDFTSGATVTNAGGGVAQVAVAGGGSLPVTGSGSGPVGDVVGVVYNDPTVVVVGGHDKDTPLNGNGAVLTDAYAQWNGGGDGLYWFGNGTDGEQSLQVRTGSASHTGIVQDKAGYMRPAQAVIVQHTEEPPDADIGPSQFAFWLDLTNSGGHLRVKAKSPDGAVWAAEILLSGV